jgi:hypothetical protein
VAALLLVGGIALAIYAFASRGSAVDSGARTAVTIAGVVFLVLFTGAAYGLYRSVFPPRARHLGLSVQSTELARGGEVVVQLELKKGKASDRLELGLVCTEFYDERRSDGRGGTTRVTAQTPAFEDWRPPPGGGDTQTMRFTVPPDAPFSYRGRCLSFVWRVSAREPKRLRFDPATNVELTVRP